MKRFIAVLTLITFILTFSISSVFAIPQWAVDEDGSLPPGLEKQGKIPYGIEKRLFDDLEGAPWAQRAIEKMNSKGLLKGRGNGKGRYLDCHEEFICKFYWNMLKSASSPWNVTDFAVSLKE
jgi:hypothetical protein